MEDFYSGTSLGSGSAGAVEEKIAAGTMASVGSGQGFNPEQQAGASPDLSTREKIYDLTDVIDEIEPAEKKGREEIIIIDGRVYERVYGVKEQIYDLKDVVEEGLVPSLIDNDLHDEIIRSVNSIAQGIAREIIPQIAERIIREEIEKLKAGS